VGLLGVYCFDGAMPAVRELGAIKRSFGHSWCTTGITPEALVQHLVKRRNAFYDFPYTN